MTCQVYYPSWVSASQDWREIKEAIQAVSVTDDWLRSNPPALKVDKSLEGRDEYFLWEPNEVSMDHEGCRALASAWRQATDRDAVFSGFNAVCDATLFGKAGIPAIIFGPGDLSTGVHGPDERIKIEDLVEGCKSYAAMAVDWCSLA